MQSELHALVANRFPVVLAVPTLAAMKFVVETGLLASLAARYELRLLTTDDIAAEVKRESGGLPVDAVKRRADRDQAWLGVAKQQRRGLRGKPRSRLDIPLSPDAVRRIADALRARQKAGTLPRWLESSLPTIMDFAEAERGWSVRDLIRVARADARVRSLLSGLGRRSDIAARLALRNPLFVVLPTTFHEPFSADLLWCCQHDRRIAVALAEPAAAGSTYPLPHAPAWIAGRDARSLAKAYGLAPDTALPLEEPAAATAAAFLEVCQTRVEPSIIRRRTKRAAKARGNISHSYGANLIARDYCGLDMPDPVIPGFWMHGWVSEYHNIHPGLIAMHKVEDGTREERDRQIRANMDHAKHWVARKDQEDLLRAAGYAHAKAIGLPFLYLPPAEVKRVPGSLLVMPPHGQVNRGPGDPLAEAYAEAIASIRHRFEHVLVCLKEDDFARRSWIDSFSRRGIEVFMNVDIADPYTLARMRRVLSTFEYMTTNGYGSHIPYAAYCGVKVSVWGPFAALPDENIERTSASQLYPGLSQRSWRLYQEDAVRAAHPEIFREPDRAGDLQAWAAAQLGEDRMLSPADLAREFGWA